MNYLVVSDCFLLFCTAPDLQPGFLCFLCQQINFSFYFQGRDIQVLISQLFWHWILKLLHYVFVLVMSCSINQVQPYTWHRVAAVRNVPGFIVNTCNCLCGVSMHVLPCLSGFSACSPDSSQLPKKKSVGGLAKQKCLQV